jgi:hypothetical protein
MADVKNKLQAVGIEPIESIAIYYDNPADTPSDELRADIGQIIATPSPDVLDALRETFNIREMPLANYAQITYPYNNARSIELAKEQANTALMDFLKERNLRSLAPVQVIFDEKGHKITYRVLVGA